MNVIAVNGENFDENGAKICKTKNSDRVLLLRKISFDSSFGRLNPKCTWSTNGGNARLSDSTAVFFPRQARRTLSLAITNPERVEIMRKRIASFDIVFSLLAGESVTVPHCKVWTPALGRGPNTRGSIHFVWSQQKPMTSTCMRRDKWHGKPYDWFSGHYVLGASEMGPYTCAFHAKRKRTRIPYTKHRRNSTLQKFVLRIRRYLFIMFRSRSTAVTDSIARFLIVHENDGNGEVRCIRTRTRIRRHRIHS